MTAHWIRVTKADPCPICGKPDYCTIGEFYICCMRSTGGRPCKNGGELFPLGNAIKLRPLPPRAAPAPTIDAGRIMDSLAGGTWPEMVEQFAASLGVTVRSLDLLGVAWSPGHRAWAVPMRDWQGNTVGIRLRLQDGSKRAVKGSRNGLFYAPGDGRVIYLTEGESDTAAAISLGLNAVGRPGCLNCIDECARLVKRKGARCAVVVADSDDPGQRGAEKLQAALSVPSVIYFAPAKDLRESVRCGLTTEMIENTTSAMVWTQPQLKRAAQ